MNLDDTGKALMELFLEAVNRYNALEKIPVPAGSRHALYHSERHLIDRVGDHPEMNITELARAAGQTKGATSQVVKKLEAKGLVRRYKRGGNDKEVFVALTRSGREVHRRHREANAETLAPLVAELRRYPDGAVDAILALFRWINAHLSRSRERMRGAG